MATIRKGSTESGSLTWGPFEAIQPVDLNMPTPPPVTPPKVNVLNFDGLITANNWDMTWSDGNGNVTHIFTKNGGIYVNITNSAGTDQTGKYRRVV